MLKPSKKFSCGQPIFHLRFSYERNSGQNLDVKLDVVVTKLIHVVPIVRDMHDVAQGSTSSHE